MDIYHIWCDLKAGARDLDLADALDRYLGHLREADLIAGYRITRRKLGLAPVQLAEFHVMLEVESLQQLDRAFTEVAGRDDPLEGLHHAVNALVTNASFALYRDFPDPARKRGAERF